MGCETIPQDTPEQSLQQAQIGVAEQKQLLAAGYFKAVADCMNQKDFKLLFTGMTCPETGCLIEINGSSKQCDTAEGRDSLRIALSSIKDPVAPENFFSMVSNISNDFTDLGKTLVVGVKDVATSSNAMALGGFYFMNKLSDKAGDRYTAQGDITMGDKETVSGIKSYGDISQKTTMGDDVSGQVAGADLITGTTETVNGVKAGTSVDINSGVKAGTSIETTSGTKVVGDIRGDETVTHSTTTTPPPVVVEEEL